MNVMYSGDAATASITDSVSVTVAGNFPTQTTVTAAPNPAVAGQTITFNVTVAPSGSSPTPTGNVYFVSGTTQLGSATLNSSGAATLNNSFGTNGNQTVTANYVGDAANQPSSASVVIGILPAIDFPTSNSTSITASAGQAGSAPLTVDAVNGFSGTVQFSCSGLPQNATCSFSPSSVTVSGSAPR